jgi:hypothetical protein
MFNFCLVLSLLAAAFILLQEHNLQGPHSCSMSFMHPRWQRVRRAAIPDSKYTLFSYHDSASTLQEPIFAMLFVPGNAGSYKQARSIGSAVLLSQSSFAVFAINFNEEYSALSGALQNEQLVYLETCIDELRALGFLKIVVVGHSVGGILAAASTADFALSLGTPMLPVLPDIIATNMLCIRRAFTVHIHGTPLDWLAPGLVGVPSDVSPLLAAWMQGARGARAWLDMRIASERDSLQVPALASAGRGADHLALLWCRELVQAVAAAMSSYGTAVVCPPPWRSCFPSFYDVLPLGGLVFLPSTMSFHLVVLSFPSTMSNVIARSSMLIVQAIWERDNGSCCGHVATGGHFNSPLAAITSHSWRAFCERGLGRLHAAAALGPAPRPAIGPGSDRRRPRVLP